MCSRDDVIKTIQKLYDFERSNRRNCKHMADKQLEALGLRFVDDAIQAKAEDDWRKEQERLWSASPMDEYKGDGFLKLLSDG